MWLESNKVSLVNQTVIVNVHMERVRGKIQSGKTRQELEHWQKLVRANQIAAFGLLDSWNKISEYIDPHEAFHTNVTQLAMHKTVDEAG